LSDGALVDEPIEQRTALPAGAEADPPSRIIWTATAFVISPREAGVVDQ